MRKFLKILFSFVKFYDAASVALISLGENLRASNPIPRQVCSSVVVFFPPLFGDGVARVMAIRISEILASVKVYLFFFILPLIVAPYPL